MSQFYLIEWKYKNNKTWRADNLHVDHAKANTRYSQVKAKFHNSALNKENDVRLVKINTDTGDITVVAEGTRFELARLLHPTGFQPAS